LAECLSHYVWKAIAVYILKSSFHIRKRENCLLCEEWKGLSQPRRKMKPHLKTYQIGKVSKLVILLAPYVLETGSHTNMEDIFLLKIIPMSTRLQIRDSRTLQLGASCDRQGVSLVDHALHRTIGSLASWRNLR